jgi:hypothetical protein
MPDYDAIIVEQDKPAQPWRGDWWVQAGKSRSSNASFRQHASTPAVPDETLVASAYAAHVARRGLRRDN